MWTQMAHISTQLLPYPQLKTERDEGNVGHAVHTKTLHILYTHRENNFFSLFFLFSVFCAEGLTNLSDTMSCSHLLLPLLSKMKQILYQFSDLSVHHPQYDLSIYCTVQKMLLFLIYSQNSTFERVVSLHLQYKTETENVKCCMMSMQLHSTILVPRRHMTNCCCSESSLILI